MDVEALRKRVLDLEQEVFSLQRKCNEFELQYEKAKGELTLRSEMWGEKEGFFKMKMVDAEQKIAYLKEQLEEAQRGGGGGGGGGSGVSDLATLELKGRLMTAEKTVAALKIELHSSRKEVEAKTMVDDAKTALIDIQEKKIEQLRRELVGVNEKFSEEKEKVSQMQRDKENSAIQAIESSGDDAQMNQVVTQSLQKVKNLEMRLAVQEKSYSSVLTHNKELKLMLHTLEDKCQAISKVAKEKVMAYVDENKALKEAIEALKEAAAAEMGQDGSFGKQLVDLKVQNQKLKTLVSDLGKAIEEKDEAMTKMKSQVADIVKALQEAGYSPETSSEDLMTVLNKSELLGDQLQKKIEDIKEQIESDVAVADKDNEAKDENPKDSQGGSGDGATADEMVEALIEEIQKEEQEIVTKLRKDIEEKKKALEELRIAKEESEQRRKEKSKLLLEAQDALLKEMASKREEMSEIRKDIKEMKQSKITQLTDQIDQLATAVAEEDSTSGADGATTNQTDEPKSTNEPKSTDAKPENDAAPGVSDEKSASQTQNSGDDTKKE